MKKLCLLMMLLMPLCVSAQEEGKWLKHQAEADELKGSSEMTFTYYLVSGIGTFIIYDFDTYQFALLSEKEQFNIKSGYNNFYGYYSGISVLIGIYDENDQLKEKITMWLDKVDNMANRMVKTRNAGGMSNPVGQKGKVKKIFKALQSGKGYVRIVAERFQSTDFDIKIPPYKE